MEVKLVRGEVCRAAIGGEAGAAVCPQYRRLHSQYRGSMGDRLLRGCRFVVARMRNDLDNDEGLGVRIRRGVYNAENLYTGCRALISRAE